LSQKIPLTRRHALLLPLFLAACGGGDDGQVYEPLRSDYHPIELNVATIDVEQRFVPSGAPPDISAKDPASPVAALQTIATDRLKPFGTSGRAVFAILDASLTQQQDVIHGTMAVSLTIYGADGSQAGLAEAHVERTLTGRPSNLRQALYDMTKTMLFDMNAEFEYQIIHNLRAWLTTPAAPDTPVEQAPLDQPPS
jgi:hypothetical protein